MENFYLQPSVSADLPYTEWKMCSTYSLMFPWIYQELDGKFVVSTA